MILRVYDASRDKESAHRLWDEVGWVVGKGESKDLFLRAGDAVVAELEGGIECMVLTAPGTIRYLEEDLPLCVVSGVTTSWAGRRRGLAKRLAALALARAAARGVLVAALGMFDQGFYDSLGFGAGAYEHYHRFDPARLRVRTKARLPRRFTVDDWQRLHAARLARARGHGAVSVTPPELTRSDMLADKQGFGLGYCDEPDGAISHCFWCDAHEKEQGPYHVRWLAYRTPEQLLELMALIMGLGDQVLWVGMAEPPGIQLQDLLEQPFKQRRITEGSTHEAGTSGEAWWQARICHLEGCLARTHLRGESLRFNLRLEDPIAAYLQEDTPWHGVGGDYVVTMGPRSSAEPGADQTLPTLTATVNAFTRLWLGVRPASSLAITDALSGPVDLMRQLDQALCLPQPHVDWGF